MNQLEHDTCIVISVIDCSVGSPTVPHNDLTICIGTERNNQSTHGPLFVVTKATITNIEHFQSRLIDSNSLYIPCKKIALRYSIKLNLA